MQVQLSQRACEALAPALGLDPLGMLPAQAGAAAGEKELWDPLLHQVSSLWLKSWHKKALLAHARPHSFLCRSVAGEADDAMQPAHSECAG